MYGIWSGLACVCEHSLNTNIFKDMSTGYHPFVLGKHFLKNKECLKDNKTE